MTSTSSVNLIRSNPADSLAIAVGTLLHIGDLRAAGDDVAAAAALDELVGAAEALRASWDD